jgi:hypothetical protein
VSKAPNRHCPHCGEALEGHAAAEPGPASDTQVRYDLEQLANLAEAEKVRVTQDDIRKLVEKRRKKAR